MTFEIEKKLLSDALEMASNAVAKKTTNPILSGIKIEAEGENIHFYATDLQTGFHKILKVKNALEEVSSFVVDQKIFSEIIKTLPGGVIKLTYDNGVLIVESGYSNFKLPTMDGKDFPDVIPNVVGNVLTLKRIEILKMIEKVIFCAIKDSDPLSRNLNGLYWDFRDGGYLNLVASDGYRLALSETHLEEENLPTSFLLSLKSMEELKSVLANSKSEEFKLNFDGSRTMFSFEEENIELVLNVVDAKYPNYPEFIPQAFKTKMTISTNEFLNTIKRVSIAAGKTEQIRINIEDVNITLMANSPDVGEAKEVIEVQKEGEDMLIAYSPRYLREAIEKLETSEFEFNISGDVNPTILKPIEDNSYMYLVMPTRWS
ncbi:DNA polymerase III subunit beta [Tepiditoga spiralis]|uniref:Beta sliding clamp n=1 Tax=Tepiditoga spiralis TaxID=2108365 RepID=A0A7G1G719_9BACT|nr:DNA polymerase III subunit beta [Tepiditoga spiralis]BBE30663.1 DNA polymerase III subunit beta [Tepiditoga spiralis]